jgi:hypothetical protein
LVNGLRAGGWPADAQASLAELADAEDAGCRYQDRAAQATSLNALRSAPGLPTAARDRLAAAKIAAYAALGM